MILILVNILYLKKKVKEKIKILLQNLTSIDDINTRKYIRSEPERIIWKIHKKQKPSSVTQICLDNILEILEVPDKVYLTISVL